MGRKLGGLDRVLDCLSLSLLCSGACACVHSMDEEEEEDDERKQALLLSSQLVQLRGFVDGAAAKTLAFHLEPKVGGHTYIPSQIYYPLHCRGTC